MFPRDVFSELLRLQRDFQQAFEGWSSIRGLERGAFPALNVGGTPQAVELYAFAPGLDPDKIEIQLERGVLTLSGERTTELPAREDKAAVHINERFAGRFRRVISLPDDIDAEGVSAEYRDGVLRVTLKRREAAQPRRIAIQ
jgi:HSP20 family protein